VLLDGGLRRRELFDVGGDHDRREGAEVMNSPPLAPGQKAADGAGVGLAGVRVANGGGEEFDEAPRRALAGVRNQGWEASGQGQDDGCEGGEITGQWAASLLWSLTWHNGLYHT
jgi:hypothetical protein